MEVFMKHMITVIVFVPLGLWTKPSMSVSKIAFILNTFPSIVSSSSHWQLIHIDSKVILYGYWFSLKQVGLILV